MDQVRGWIYVIDPDLKGLQLKIKPTDLNSDRITCATAAGAYLNAYFKVLGYQKGSGNNQRTYPSRAREGGR